LPQRPEPSSATRVSSRGRFPALVALCAIIITLIVTELMTDCTGRDINGADAPEQRKPTEAAHENMAA
jgi:hypothetical protein